MKKKAAKKTPTKPSKRVKPKGKPATKATRTPAAKATRKAAEPKKKRAAAPRRNVQALPTTDQKPLTKVPAAPVWLGQVAATKWREVAPVIEARGLLEDLDLDALSLYCDSWQQLSEADATIVSEGEFFTTDKGYVGIHPAVLKRRKAIDVIRKLGEQLGLTPRSRRGLRVKQSGAAAAEDPLAAFLKSKPRGTA